MMSGTFICFATAGLVGETVESTTTFNLILRHVFHRVKFGLRLSHTVSSKSSVLTFGFAKLPPIQRDREEWPGFWLCFPSMFTFTATLSRENYLCRSSVSEFVDRCCRTNKVSHAISAPG